MLHVDDLGLASGKALEDVTEIFGGDVDIDVLHRLEEAAVSAAAEDDLGRETRSSKPSRRICLDEDGDLHFAAGLDLEVPRPSRCRSTSMETLAAGLADQALA